MKRRRLRPRLEPLEGRATPSTASPTVVVTNAPQSPADTDQGYAPGLGGSPGGSGDRGAPPGILGD